MPDLNIYQQVNLDLSEQPLRIGDRHAAKTITVNGDVYDVRETITNTSGDNFNSQTLWTTGDGGFDTFAAAIISADADALIEFRNAEGTPDFASVKVTKDGMVVLTADDLLAAGSGTTLGSDGSATTMGVIDRVVAKNNQDASAEDKTVTIRLVLIK